MAQSSAQPKSSGFWEAAKPFLIGGISGMTATSCIQPIDTVKVRIQIVGEENAKKGIKQGISPFSVAGEVFKNEGLSGLYKGIDSALLRQILYATTRLGLFKTISDKLREKKGRNLTLFEKVSASLFAGLVGAMVGNPADVCLVRFQGDSLLPPAERRNYKNAFDALTRMAKEEGILSFWRGATPTVVRAMLINMGMLATFDECKERLNKWTGTKDTTSTKIISSFISGFVCACVSLPADNLKTKLQRMKAGPDGKLPYKGFFDCFAQSVKREGVTGLWVGLPTYIFRVGPHAIITLLTQDYLHAYFSRKH